MLALAKFWLPFQKWRIIGKKRLFFTGSDLAATIVIAFKWFEDVSWILMDSRRSDVQPASTKTFFWTNDRSDWEADWQISQNILPPPEAICNVADADSDAGTNFSQGLFFCHEGRKARRRSSFSYFACFSPASLFFLGWRRRYAIQISPHVVFTISCQATFSRLNAAVHQRNNSG